MIWWGPGRGGHLPAAVFRNKLHLTFVPARIMEWKSPQVVPQNMTRPRCVIRFFVYFAALAVAARVQALTVDPGPGSGDWMFYSSPAMVEGRPAIAYVSSSGTAFSTEIKYV